MTALALGWPAARAVDPAPDEAREALARELGRSEYQQPLAARALDWLSGLLDRLGDAAAGSGALGTTLTVVLAVVLVAGLAVALARLRRDGGREHASAPVFASQRRTAQEHRQRATAALREERYDDAVLESLRALTTGLVERDLLVDAVGLTALEATRAAAGRFPDLADRLDGLRRDFDDVRYGGARPDLETATRAVALAEQVAAATPSSSTTSPTGPAVPS